MDPELSYTVCQHLLIDPIMSSAEDNNAKRMEINAEAAKIAWRELQRFFAQGYAIGVSNKLDLIEVAYQLAEDNKEQLELWMEAGQVGQVSDTQALEWYEANTLVWAVVIRPWVVVQPVLK